MHTHSIRILIIHKMISERACAAETIVGLCNTQVALSTWCERSPVQRAGRVLYCGLVMFSTMNGLGSPLHKAYRFVQYLVRFRILFATTHYGKVQLHQLSVWSVRAVWDHIGVNIIQPSIVQPGGWLRIDDTASERKSGTIFPCRLYSYLASAGRWHQSRYPRIEIGGLPWEAVC